MSSKPIYLYNNQLGSQQFSKDHLMKPIRIKITHSLIDSYGITPQLLIIESRKAKFQELIQYHHPNYVRYLQTWIMPPQNSLNQQKNIFGNSQMNESIFKKDSKLGQFFKVNHNVDCPGFSGLFNFCQLAAGSSLDAADAILTGMSNIVINWGGGYHHSKKSQASGFCYINDIVLCILQLLNVYQRVLYIDIDVHHGDGVQQAFNLTNRVMTVSFHQFQEGFFPQTGSLSDIGDQKGKYYTVNVPLKRGISGEAYRQLFRNVMKRVVEVYQPDVIVTQCGADSLAGDKLGNFNLTMKDHADCLNFMKKMGIPMILLGGGGYTIQNVARCWAYETGQMIGVDLDNQIPEDVKYSQYLFSSNGRNMHIPCQQDLIDQNSRAYTDYIVKTIYQNLRQCQAKPGIQIHHVPNFQQLRNSIGQQQQMLTVQTQQNENRQKLRKSSKFYQSY